MIKTASRLHKCKKGSSDHEIKELELLLFITTSTTKPFTITGLEWWIGLEKVDNNNKQPYWVLYMEQFRMLMDLYSLAC